MSEINGTHHSSDPLLEELIQAEESYLDARDREDRAREMAGADEYQAVAEFVTAEERRRMMESGCFG